MTVVTRVVALATIAAASFITTPSHAQSRTIWVQNNGSDTPTCGLTRSQACRSISAGIARANAGDIILVGPGRYGDIDNDLQYVTPGDEAASLGFGCVVCINKGVTVASTDGADVTVIDPGRPGPGQSLPPELARTVLIQAPGVRFGAPGQGFTVYGLWSAAVWAEGVANLRVIGNVTQGGGAGFELLGQNGPLYVAQNKALNAEGDGIGVAVINSQATVIDNLAIGNGNGVSVSVSELGAAAPPLVAGNKAVSNQAGFSFFSSPPGNNIRLTISNNLASANRFGFVFETSGLLLQRNTAIGNESGFLILGRPDGFPNSFHTNNMIGNRLCGVRNRSGTHVDATNNFWGSSAGPGPKPSDTVCNEPLDFGPPNPPFPSTTTVVPFATRAF